MPHQSEQVKGGNVVDVRTGSGGTLALVNEIKRTITKAVRSEMMEIGQYVIDTVFQSDSQRALSGPLSTSTARRKAFHAARRPDGRRRVNRIQLIKRP